MSRQVVLLRLSKVAGNEMFGPGLVLLVFGLFKKVCLADNISSYSDLAFAPGAHLQTSEAWVGAVIYALQLFFDFSGYSDMAIGLGLMFGFRLPNNFLVPFSATSMIDYWKRWHITMTRFFTMYAYMPLALSFTRYSLNRELRGLAKFGLTVLIPTLVTFLLSGLWHGAGWTFVMFGVVNGVGVTVNHGWRAAKYPALPNFVGWALTATTILVTLVYFRSGSVADAHAMLHEMFVPRHLFSAPEWVTEKVPELRLATESFELFGDPRQTCNMLLWIVILAPLSVMLPPIASSPEKLRPDWLMGLAIGGMAMLVTGLIDQPRSFLYFAF